jgi:hypothetical protein
MGKTLHGGGRIPSRNGARDLVRGTRDLGNHVDSRSPKNLLHPTRDASANQQPNPVLDQGVNPRQHRTVRKADFHGHMERAVVEHQDPSRHLENRCDAVSRDRNSNAHNGQVAQTPCQTRGRGTGLEVRFPRGAWLRGDGRITRVGPSPRSPRPEFLSSHSALPEIVTSVAECDAINRLRSPYRGAARVAKGSSSPVWIRYSRLWVVLSASTRSPYGRSVTSTRPIL